LTNSLVSDVCHILMYRCDNICWRTWWESRWSYFMGIISSSWTCQWV